MEQNWKILQNATESLRHFVKAFDVFRIDNLLLSDLLEKIECLLETTKYKTESEVTTENEKTESYIDTDTDMEKTSPKQNQAHADQLRTEQKSEFAQCTRRNKKRDFSTQNGLPTIENVNLSSKTEDIEAVPEKSPEDQVFAIDWVLHSILTNLPPSDLKACRLVSPTWISTATQILLKMQAFKIKFDFNEVSEDDDERLSSHQKKFKDYHDLALLSEVMGNGIQFPSQAQIQFPCNSFSFVFPNLGSHNLKSFLKKFGHTIKHLEIRLYNNDQLYDRKYMDFDPETYTEFKILADFRNLLTNDLPNLESLLVGSFPVLWEQTEDLSELFPEPASSRKPISNLKSLRFFVPPPRKILVDLLESCPSLVDVGINNNSEELLLKSLMRMNRVHLLTRFHMTLSNENLDYYEKFLCGNLKDLHLKKLHLLLQQSDDEPDDMMRVSQVLTNCLRSCAKSLTELFSEPLGDCLGLEFPVMPNLKRIHFYSLLALVEPIDGKLFPEELRLSEIFPRLESFEVSVLYRLSEYSDLDWEDNVRASTDDVLESVKLLRFRHGPPAEWVENFSALFPNLRTVEIGIVEDFQLAAKALWKLEKLETLSVGFNLDENDEEDRNTWPAIEAGFTGFSHKTCLMLHDDSRKVDVSELNAMREGPSILDAKNLRSLNLSIYDSSEDDRDEGIVPVMSHVTGLFAFKLCPQLHVNLCVGSKMRGRNMRGLLCGLSPIMPYVHTFKQEGNIPLALCE